MRDLCDGVGRYTPKINVIRDGYKASLDPLANIPTDIPRTAVVTTSCEM